MILSIIANPLLAAVKPKSNPIRGQATWSKTCPGQRDQQSNEEILYFTLLFFFFFIYVFFLLLLHFHFAGNKRSRRALLRQRHATKLNFMNAAALRVFMNRIHKKARRVP